MVLSLLTNTISSEKIFKIDDENHDIARYIPPSKENKQKSFFVFLLFLNKHTCIEFMNTVEKYISKMELSSYLKHGKVLNQTWMLTHFFQIYKEW